MLVNLVKAVTTRSTDLAEEDEKQPPTRTDTDQDDTQETEVSEEISSNTYNKNSRDTSVKEMQQILFPNAS